MVVHRRKSHKSKKHIKKTGKNMNKRKVRGQKPRKTLRKRRTKSRQQKKHRIVQTGGFTNPFGGLGTAAKSVPNFFKGAYNTVNPPPPAAASNPASNIESPNPTKGHYSRLQPAPSVSGITDLKKSFQGA